MTDIILQNISAGFEGKTVLDSVNLRFKAGEINFIEGPSGSGKTTLLNIIAGFLSPDSGTVTGIPGKISYMFQEDRLCEDFSALSNVKLVKNKSKAEAENLLRALGITELKKPVRTFSGGMKRRVALARTLIAEAELFLLDEPFKGLDSEIRKAAINQLLKCTAGKTVIIVTHDPEEIEAISPCGNRIFLEKQD